MAESIIKNMNPTLKATASANKTYSSQLTDLTSAYNALSDVQKARSYIVSGNYIYLPFSTNGSYIHHDGGATGVVGYTLNAVYHSAYKITGTTTESLANTTNSNSMQLYA